MEANGQPLTVGQRAMLALDLIDQGVPADQARAQFWLGERAIEKAQAALQRRPDLADSLRDGTISLNKAQHLAGFMVEGGRAGRLGVAYGKGDKWKEASSPLLRYLHGWRTRNFEFRHLNPREARKRLRRIEHIEELLAEVKGDLEPRAQRATLSIETRRERR